MNYRYSIVATLAFASAAFAQTPCENLKSLNLPNVTFTKVESVAAGPFQPPTGPGAAQAAAAGAIFLAVFAAVQWPWANFLMSPRSANWIFGTGYFAYFDSPNGYDFRRLFFPAEPTRAQFWLVMAEALVAAILSSRLGLAWGDWVRKIRR